MQPTEIIYLNANQSSDPDGTIAGYNWVQISGPNKTSITKANEDVALVRGHIAGEYVFHVTVTDNKGATATATVNVSVRGTSNTANQAPVANAGTNQTIIAPASSANLNGSASYDPDGRIIRYSWSQVSGPRKVRFNATNRANVTVSNLSSNGTYTFRLTVTDDKNVSRSATVNVVRSRYGTATLMTAENSTLGSLPEGEEIISAKTGADGIAEDGFTGSVYPNPAQNQVQVVVEHNYTGRIQLSVLDMSGSRVLRPMSFEKGSSRFQTTLDLSSLKAGVYNVQVLLGDNIRKTLRVVKM